LFDKLFILYRDKKVAWRTPFKEDFLLTKDLRGVELFVSMIR